MKESQPSHLYALRWHRCRGDALLDLPSVEEQMSWPYASPALALRKVGPAPHLGNIVELVLMAQSRVSKLWTVWPSPSQAAALGKVGPVTLNGQHGGVSSGGIDVDDLAPWATT